MPVPPVTAGVPTTLQFGTYNALNDTFTKTIDLNDGINWSIVDSGNGEGDGLDLGNPSPTIYDVGNPRTVGRVVTRQTYDTNRTIVAKLLLGQFSSYATFIGTLRALTQAVVAVSPTSGNCLKIQVVQSNSPVYADLQAAYFPTGSPMYRETLWNQLIDSQVEVIFVCRGPYLRGPRQTLSNLAMNPGFETPSGPAVTAFKDVFNNVSAYAVTTGGAPTLTPANTYVDIIQGDAPVRYYRLGEASGTSAYDIGGTYQTGTTHGSPTQGVSGLISGDTGTCYTFAAASSQYITCPGSSTLPSANQPMSIECWMKYPSTPASSTTLMAIGDSNTSHKSINLYINTSGNVVTDIGGGGTSISTALSNSTIHHLVVTWDGTTMTLYIDGSSAGTSTPGNQTVGASPPISIGANSTAANFFSGQIQEVCVYAVKLSPTQVSNHYTAGHTGATGTLANAMTIQSNSRLKFGSPVWGNPTGVNVWKTRWRWNASIVNFQLFMHYTSNNDRINVTITPTAFSIVEAIAGVSTTIATTAIVLVPEAYYWIGFTQFPSAAGATTTYSATLYTDNQVALGPAITTISGTAGNETQTLVGAPQIAANGSTLVLAGSTTVGGNSVALFGPGSWSSNSVTATTFAPSSFAWDTTAANTYSGGPVTSLGAARFDLPPAGTVSAQIYSNGPTIDCVPVATAGNIIALSAWMKSSGLGSSASTTLQAAQYTSAHSLITTTTIATLTGNQANWTQMSGTVTTNGSCAFIEVILQVADAVSADSANGIVWFDNVQVYDQTATGQTTMPYCELRFFQSPAPILISGIKGDVATPCLLQAGTQFPNTFGGATVMFYCGRRAVAASGWVPIGIPVGTLSGTPDTVTLDGTQYGGYYWSNGTTITSFNSASWQVNLYATPTTPNGAFGTELISEIAGSYRLFQRFYSTQSTGNIANIKAVLQWSAYAYNSQGGNVIPFVFGNIVAPLSTTTTWTVCDLGLVTWPPSAVSLLQNAANIGCSLAPNWEDTTGGGSNGRSGWLAHLPVDGDVIVGQATFNGTVLGPWWEYWDGTGTFGAQPGAPLFNTGGAVGGTTGGLWPDMANAITCTAPNLSSGFSSAFALNSLSDPVLRLDPTIQIAGASVNQMVAWFDDTTGAQGTMPVYLELVYSPMYLFPL